MKISLSTDALQQALLDISKATPTRSTVPILNSILFQARDGALTLRATDLEITMVISVSANVHEEGTVAIPHRKLMEISTALPKAELVIEADEKNRVRIEAPFGNYDIGGSSAEEFPATPEVDNEKDVVISTEALRRLIGKTVFALSGDELKPALMGSLFEYGEDSITAVATDGHRLSICSRSDYKARGFTGDVIVPKKFLQLTLQHMGEDEDVVLWIGENHMTVAFGNMTIFSRIIDERYPDYRSVLPEENNKTVRANREDLLGTVKRVSIFSNRSTRQITLNLSKESNSVATEDPESASSAEERIDIDYDGDDMVIGYNAAYLSDLLSHLDTDTVIMKLKTPVSAGLILPDTQAENEDITMLLMPMRTSSQ